MEITHAENNNSCTCCNCTLEAAAKKFASLGPRSILVFGVYGDGQMHILCTELDAESLRMAVGWAIGMWADGFLVDDRMSETLKIITDAYNAEHGDQG